MTDAALEIQEGNRFSFGDNWARFLTTLSDERIAEAERSLQDMLEVSDLTGKRFLDIGSGSGLFSLAARRLGADVESFDYDQQSVACTSRLRQLYFSGNENWVVKQGSVLDRDFMNSLEKADIVYSWGVLHHTGSMWKALDNAARVMKPGGKLFIAIYNDEGRASKRWSFVKKAYNQYKPLRPLILLGGFVRMWALSTVRDLVCGKPFRTWNTYKKSRGMSPWYDVIDWVGGWPFEYASPEAIFDFYKARGFTLSNMITRQGHGCNEFVFVKN
jgi:SAM-dependent methyltransferase